MGLEPKFMLGIIVRYIRSFNSSFLPEYSWLFTWIFGHSFLGTENQLHCLIKIITGWIQ